LEPTSSAFLENSCHRAVIFRRDEQHCVSGLDALAERGPWRGRRVGLKILIIKRHLPDLDDVERQQRWRERDQRIRQHPVERSLPQAVNQYAHIDVSMVIFHYGSRTRRRVLPSR
jgi:hypothetical protein